MESETESKILVVDLFLDLNITDNCEQDVSPPMGRKLYGRGG